MKRIIWLFFMFMMMGGIYAQKTQERVIKWGGDVYPGIYDKKEYLWFEGAHYKDYNNMLPYYSELVEIGSDSASFMITSKKYNDLSFEQAKSLPGNAGIAGQLSVHTKIVTIRKQQYLYYEFVPLIKSGRGFQYLQSFEFTVEEISRGGRKSSLHAHDFKSGSVLANGDWVKVGIPKNGVYKMSYQDLKDAGIGNPDNVRVYSAGGGVLPKKNNAPRVDDLEEVPVKLFTGDDGSLDNGDYILFYAQGPDQFEYDTASLRYIYSKHPYADHTYYYLTSDKGRGQEIGLLSTISGAEDMMVNSYDYIEHHENEWINLLKSGAKWYGEDFVSEDSREFSYQVPGLDFSSAVKLYVNLCARNSSDNFFSLSIDGNSVSNITIPAVSYNTSTGFYAREGFGMVTFTPQDENFKLTISQDNSNPTSRAWLDYITLHARKSLAYQNEQLSFRDHLSAGEGNIVRFSIDGANNSLLVWDVTDLFQVSEVQGSISQGIYSFKADGSVTREYVCFNPGSDPLKPKIFPADEGKVPNQDLHSLSGLDMVIVHNKTFESHAMKLKNLHQEKSGLEVVAVTPEMIYNEFSSGMPDITAIRDFMRMLYKKASTDDEMPRYLLFIGDGSYDNRPSAKDNEYKILTYQSPNSLYISSSFVSDDYFGLLDDNEGDLTDYSSYIDIGIGRLPVNTNLQADAVVQKIEQYVSMSSMGDWRNDVCFIGDDEDGNIHMVQADSLAKLLQARYPVFNVDKIYLDAYEQEISTAGERYPEANKAINDKINKGALIINYTGHGGEGGLAHEAIMQFEDIQSWQNFENLPLFVTATCEFSRYDDPARTSAGEYVLLNPAGGAFGLLSTTRLVYSGPNHILNVNFYNHIFEKDAQGKPLRLGDVFRLTKNNSGSSTNKRNFSLLGDPAITLAYPTFNVVTDSINFTPATSFNDTIKALSKVTISGHVENPDGSFNDFNGILYQRVFDKSRTVTTLSNDGLSPFNFDVQNNLLYRGKSSINDGYFKFSFIVPKDISYVIGNGRISYYATNDQVDGNGYNDEVLIGGTADKFEVDNTGPEISLFMNDESFADGGMTDENPVIYAKISDSSGINTVGNGIGHDITATLDDDSKNVYILNDYYEADLDNYQNGTIEYPLSGLAPGEHKLKLKVWDVHNNSSFEEVTFVVAESEELALDHVLNYPNPFTTNTGFYFEHNRPGQEMDILIQVFTVSGKLVKTIESQLEPDGFRCGPFYWNGLDDFGDKIGKGVYIYRVKVRSGDEIAEKYQKLVILN